MNIGVSLQINRNKGRFYELKKKSILITKKDKTKEQHTDGDRTIPTHINRRDSSSPQKPLFRFLNTVTRGLQVWLRLE